MIVAVDTETTGLDVWHGCRPYLVTACDGEYLYHWWGEVNPYDRSEVTWDEDDLEEIIKLFEQADEIVFHNAKFDLHMLEHIGIPIFAFWEKYHDTMISAHLHCSGESHALKYLAYKYLDFPDDDEDELQVATQRARQKHKDWDIARKQHPTMPGDKGSVQHGDYWLCPDECLRYGFGDVVRTHLLHLVYIEWIKKEGLYDVYLQRIEHIRPVYEMESQGYHVYLDMIEKDIAELKKEKEKERKMIQWEARFPRHFDPGKKQDLKELFNHYLKLDSPLDTPNGDQSFKKEAVDLLIENNPEVPALIHFKNYNKATTKIQYLTSYTVWHKDSYIHPNFWITGTRETRKSCERPNLQNIDRTSRHYFGPPPGYYWIDMDLENIEMAIWVYEVGNYKLIELFESGKSIHIYIASLPGIRREMVQKLGVTEFKKQPEYNFVKNGNFSIIYGATESKADITYKVMGAYKKVVGEFPETGTYSSRIIDEVEYNLSRYGRPFITTLGGYRLDVPLSDIFKACNYKIQGSAGFIMMRGVNRIYKSKAYKRSGGRMINDVHDSLVIQQPLKGNHEDHKKIADEYVSHLTDEPLLKTCRAEYKLIYHPDLTPF